MALRPYYAERGVKLFHGDMREVTPLLATVACIVTDPPYEETPLGWDRWPQSWPTLVATRLAPTGSLWCFGSLRLFMRRASEFAAWRFAEDLVWEKPNGSGFAKDRLRRVHELVGHFYLKDASWPKVYKDVQRTPSPRAGERINLSGKHKHMGARVQQSYTYDTRLARSVQRFATCHGYAEHPTQKPLDLLRFLIRTSAPPASTVFDPFAGSGSTLLAARAEGRLAVGIEADEASCEIAARRLKGS